jgi:CheY-like chemotaxis protein
MIISSSAQLIQDNLERRNVIERYTLQIRDASEKAASLTRQLLAFSRKQVLQLVVLDLNVIVAELCKMLPRLLGEDISVDLALAGDLGRILADRGQIEQVVMNLGVNARDAMPTGGKLTIETRNVDLDQEYIGAHGVKGTPGKYVMLSITDSGVGMSDEVKAKIFEPFFTTKEIGKGTGLGLATVYGIVKQSNGWIWVYSEPGKGSTFKVYLPRTAETGAPEQKASLAESASGTETILIVEDEAALRQVTSDFLEAKGYHVLQANDGPSALVLIAESSNDINLLITDMVMPGFGGAQLAQEFLARRPNGSVIFVSGYSERATSDDLTGSQKAFLQKPFSLNSLARTMRSLLDHRPADSGQSS